MLYGLHLRLLLQQTENALPACKGLVEVCGQGRHGNDRTEAAEHGGHAQHHAPHAEAAAVNEKDSYSQHYQHRQRHGGLRSGGGKGRFPLEGLRSAQHGVGAAVDFGGPGLSGVIENQLSYALNAVEKIRAEVPKLPPVPHTGLGHAAGEKPGQQNADAQIGRRRDHGQIPACSKPGDHHHRQGYKHGDADGGNGMGVEHLQRFDVRRDHGEKAALLPAFQLGGAKHPELGKDFVSKHRQQPEGDIVVAVLLQIPQSSAQDAAAHTEGRNGAVGQGDALAQGLRDTHRAEKGHAHSAQKAEASIQHRQQHDGGKPAAQELHQLRRNLYAASEGKLFFHACASFISSR